MWMVDVDVKHAAVISCSGCLTGTFFSDWLKGGPRSDTNKQANQTVFPNEASGIPELQ